MDVSGLDRTENPFIGTINIINPQAFVVQLVDEDTDEIIDFNDGDPSAQLISRNVTVNYNLGIPVVDTWLGRFCNQDHSDYTSYRRFEHYMPYTYQCGDQSNNFTMTHFPMWRGEYYFRHLRFEDKGFDGDTRYIRFSLTYNGTYLYIDTPDFEIYDLEFVPNTIGFVNTPPANVTANTPITIGLRLENNVNQVVNDTLYSKMQVITSVSMLHGVYYFIGGLQETHTDCILGGPDVYIHPTNQRRIKSNFDAGLTNVTFQMEDVGVDITMNFTLKLHKYTYRRYPEDEYYHFFSVACSFFYFDLFFDTVTKLNSSHIMYKMYRHDPNYFRATKLVNFTVVAQTPAALRIVPGQVINSMQIANFEFDNPIQVELVDAANNRVTSGPDSNLLVQTFSNTPGVELSYDSEFYLERGIGTFRGSIFKVQSSITLAFRVTSSAGVLSTADSSPFSVSGNWNFVMHGAESQEEMVYAALRHGWRYYWLGIRWVTFHNLASTQEVYEKFVDGKNSGDQRIICMLGPDDEAKHAAYAAVAGAFDIPVLGYSSTDSKYSDKQQHKFYKRVAFSDSYRYATIGSALKSRNWNRMAVVVENGFILPDDFVYYCNLFKIYYIEIKFPSVSSSSDMLSQEELDSFFGKLSDARTKLIWSFLTGHALTYVLAESTKRGVTPTTGYTWLGEESLTQHFPYNNEGHCSSLIGTTCTEAFRGTIMFKSTYPNFGFKGTNWGILSADYANKYSKSFNLSKLGDEDERTKAILAHDAGVLMVIVLRHFFNNHLTMNAEKILEHMDAICDSCVDLNQLLSGTNIKFDENSDRKNYTAFMLQIDPVGGAVGKENILKKKRFLHLGELAVSNVTANHTITEIPVAGETFIHSNISTSNWNAISMQMLDTSLNADFSYTNTPATETVTTESTPPAFYCTGGCGGQLLSTENRVYWSHGTCVEQDVCRCNIDPLTGNPGYIGVNCETAQCSACLFGTCEGPSNCVCDAGYVNSANASDCGVPTCLTYGCDLTYGECTAADFCKCQDGYYGKDCTGKCDCQNGKCSDGESGSGQCTCDAGYIGSKCSTHQAIIIAPTFIGIVLLLALLFVVGRHKYRQMQMMADLMSTDWKADWDNVRMRQKMQKSSMKSLVSMMSMMSAKSNKQEEKVVCQNQGMWNGREIVAKMIRKDDIELTDEIRWEIKQMKDLKHPNLCPFVGACIESPNICILNEVCGKGSLEDLLGNDSVELGWNFRYSMLKDICRGMSYLGKSDIKSHGRLKSSNCLVDNRWCVRLADYGLKSFKADQYGIRMFSPSTGMGVELPRSEEMEGCDYYNLLWTAPEIIATGVSHPNHVGYGTIAGDIYSFAIIFVEMCTRHHPFHELDHLAPYEIVQMVGRLIPLDKRAKLSSCKDADGLAIDVLRPEVAEDFLPVETEQATGLQNLIEACWNQDPTCRPTFDGCMKLLNKINPHRGELMDNLIVLMEHYTNSLEAIVAERTCDVKEEKEKGDLLLSKMLPPLIAEELKSGSKPVPEYFNCVTIYFSDVVGFGKLCADCSPYQVVELLNELYSVMDDVMDSFDCYKVETIGDCYMVVSGLPVRNGDNHAGEIASMALQLLTTYNGVGYKHLDGSQVQLRIGMHSGPCVAGVVGLKMPRYCLFGDTVNTASRMESGGFALKIHLSEDTYKILESLGGYQFECRGERQVKGRGAMTTYWLTGKEGGDYNLPTEELALSASQHDFK